MYLGRARRGRDRRPSFRSQISRHGGRGRAFRAERSFQRLAQEYGSGIHSADVIDSSDATHFLFWKKAGFLAPFVPEEVAEHIPADYRDPDGYDATRRATLSVMGYNIRLLKPEEAPKSFADLLDPKWKGKLVKAHPGYTGTILTSTYALVHALGWPDLEALGKQNVMQVQSANDPLRLLQVDPAAAAEADEIKPKYSQYFGI